jgi:RNA methyltransferase, TrmH family
MEKKMKITSLTNPRVKKVVKLRDRRTRDNTGLFLIEGYRELLRAIDGGVEVEELFISREFFLGDNEDSLIKSCSCQVFECEKSVFKKISYRDRPDGLLAVAKQRQCVLENYKNPFIVVAEAIEKPGNLGTILRSADGAGVDAVIVCDRCTDVHNPNVVRASVGTLFTLPVVEMSSEDAMKWLRDHGVKIIAATPSTDNIYTDTDLTGPVAVVVGTEQYGLTDLWMDKSDCKIKIPMLGYADSLNVATATTLLLYEVLRQR